MPRHIIQVMTNPVPGKEAEFNDWYSNVHVQEVVQVPGFVSARRFKLADAQMSGTHPYRYLAVYEVDTDDVGAALEALRQARAAFNMSDALDPEREVWAYTPISDVVTEAE